MTTEATPVAKAVRIFGTQAAVADILGITQPSVAGWKDGRIPVQHIPRLVQAAKDQGKRLRLVDLIAGSFT